MPGRGGFGNIASVAEANERSSADLEANQQSAESAAQPSAFTDSIAQQEQQYAHSGRGGAGNYYSPKELNAKGQFSDAHRSHIIGDGTLAPSDSTNTSAPPSYNAVEKARNEPTRTYGRGGAGNYSFGVSESEERAARKRIDEEQKRERLREEIERGVEEGLAVPQQAKLPAGEPY